MMQMLAGSSMALDATFNQEHSGEKSHVSTKETYYTH